MKTPFTFAFFLTIFLVSNNSIAGFAGGPYFLFINSANNKKIDEIINKKISEKEDCSKPDMQIIDTPDWISQELINKAMVAGDKKAISKLDTLIRKKHPDYSMQGLDGIILYSENPMPQFSNFVRGRKVILKDRLGKSANDEAIWSAFCLMVPPITRPV
ncbi:hypothetical protein [Pseudoduganella sp. HUAS MS19]